MAWLYRHLVKPCLFLQDPEQAHRRALACLGFVSRSGFAVRQIQRWVDAPDIPVAAMGLRFPNPFGLAAGMDKRAEAAPLWRALGFGFSELGGVTLHPQAGNPEPRMFRVPAERALINRMGFNNPGAAEIAAVCSRWRKEGLWPEHPVGFNLGKSRIATGEQAAADYRGCFETLWPHGDFFVVNVSSPNTPNLRRLQERPALEGILSGLLESNARLAGRAGRAPKPLLVKIAPDLTPEAVDEIADLAVELRLSGVVAVNTTVQRPAANDLATELILREKGGLSGRPLFPRALEVIRRLRRRVGPEMTLVGVGGVSSADDVWRMAAAGATLVQAYSAFVYEGPGWPAAVVEELADRLAGSPWRSVVDSAV